ncbi:MAG: hypothetical protein R3B84_03745 [Zavarzinella sp.]
MPMFAIARSEMRAPDWGPYYVETPEDLTSFRGIAEPWNAVSAALFVLIVIFWVVRIWGRFRQFPFLTVCMPILLVGGIGGTIYHGTRSHYAYFLMDVVPINLLGLAVSIFMWVKLAPRWYHLLGMIAVVFFMQMLGHWQLPRPWAINLSYALLALAILIPILLTLIKTSFFGWRWIVSALAAFVIGWFARIADYAEPPPLPMGTHWVWHTFGAITTMFIAQYLYQVEGRAAKNMKKISEAESAVISA